MADKVKTKPKRMTLEVDEDFESELGWLEDNSTATSKSGVLRKASSIYLFLARKKQSGELANVDLEALLSDVRA